MPDAHAYHWEGGSFRPTGSRVLVRLDPKLAVTEGGIVIPDAFRRAAWWGEVVAMGPGRWDEETGRRDDMDIPMGARVFFGCYNGIRVDQQLGIDDGHEYWVMEQWKSATAGTWWPDIYAVEVPGG